MRALLLILALALSFIAGCVAEVSICQAPTPGHYYVIQRQVGTFGDGRSEIIEYKVNQDGTFEKVRRVR